MSPHSIERVLVRLERRTFEPDGVGEGHDVGNDRVRSVIVSRPLDEADLDIKERRRREPRVARSRGPGPDRDHIGAATDEDVVGGHERAAHQGTGNRGQTGQMPAGERHAVEEHLGVANQGETNSELAVVIGNGERSADEQILARHPVGRRCVSSLAQPPEVANIADPSENVDIVERRTSNPGGAPSGATVV